MKRKLCINHAFHRNFKEVSTYESIIYTTKGESPNKKNSFQRGLKTNLNPEPKPIQREI